MTSDISGYWNGLLNTGSARMRLTFRLEFFGRAGTAWLRTRAQGDVALPLTRRGARLRFEAQSLDILLELTSDLSGERLVGSCRSSGAAFPVTFERGLPPTEPRSPRPQTPAPPFAYEVRAVGFSAADGSRLAGTLTLPPNGAPLGAVVLSTWFGRVDRDQTTAGHRPFAIWADMLTRRGLATLRYDKRGAGESGGDFDSVTTADSATDLVRAVDFLRAQAEIDPDRVGLMGHSEGGHISADVAAADRRIAFCVLLTPTGAPEEDFLETEMFRAAAAVGGRPLHPARSVQLVLGLSAVAKTAPTDVKAMTRISEVLAREVATGRFPKDRVALRTRIAASPWRMYWLNYDHTKSLRALVCPALVVFAGRDLQTPPVHQAPNVRAALSANPLARIVELPDLNHFLQRAVTGAPSEYAAIEQTLAPEAIETVCDWISNTTAR